MDGAADAALGAWASVRGFFTPATLFLVVNLVIGTIALTSRSRRRAHDHDGDHQEPPFRQAQEHQQQDSRYYDDQRHEEQRYVPAPLARTSSVMDRLRSIGLYRFRSGDFPPEYTTPVGTDSRDAPVEPAMLDAHHHARSRSEPAREEFRRPAPSRMRKSSSVARKAEVPRAPAAGVVRAFVPEEDEREDDDDVLHYTREDELTGGGNSYTAQQHAPVELQHEESEEEENYYREEYVPPLRPAPLTRAPEKFRRAVRRDRRPGRQDQYELDGHAAPHGARQPPDARGTGWSPAEEEERKDGAAPSGMAPRGGAAAAVAGAPWLSVRISPRCAY